MVSHAVPVKVSIRRESVSMKKQKKPYRENLEVSETSRQEVQGKYSVKSLTVNRDAIHPGTPSGDSVTVGQCNATRSCPNYLFIEFNCNLIEKGWTWQQQQQQQQKDTKVAESRANSK